MNDHVNDWAYILVTLASQRNVELYGSTYLWPLKVSNKGQLWTVAGIDKPMLSSELARWLDQQGVTELATQGEPSSLSFEVGTY